MTLVLMIFGLANLVGTFLAGFLIERSLRLTLAIAPMLLGAAAIGLAAWHAGYLLTICLVVVWGVAYGGIPVSWSTWMARAVPEQTESGGGLIVAAVQLAITAGAAGGGVIFASTGVTGVFATAGMLTLGTSFALFAGFVIPRST